METVKVFDTRVKAAGQMFHFDVMTGDESTALKLANDYVAALGQLKNAGFAMQSRWPCLANISNASYMR